MPIKLFKFAIDPRRYELNGSLTLHDAWIESLNIFNKYYANEIKSFVQLRLLLANQSYLDLFYSDVIAISYLNKPNRWPHRAVDLLTHEFQADNLGNFTHSIEFDRGVWMTITFKSFDVKEIPKTK